MQLHDLIKNSKKSLFLGALFLFLFLLSSCSFFPSSSDAPVITLPPTLTLPPPVSSSPTSTPTNSDQTESVCTPPPCASNEAYFCSDDCPGGCGTICATHTPTVDESNKSDAPTPTPTTIRFAVIGDFGQSGNPAADVAAMIKSWQPDFIITTGDNNYPNGAGATIDLNIGQYYQEYIFPYKGQFGDGADDINRFFPTLGNHDWTSNQAQPYFDYFELPGNERYYDFVWGPIHFFAISSDSREPDGVGRSSLQAQWLQTRLAASTAPWKIVYMHHPPYASTSTEPVDWIRWPFAEWGADIVVAGHDHFYERLEVDGFPYIINGLGGGPIYAFGETYPGSQVRYNDDYGALFVEANENQVIFTFKSRAGEIIDTYRLSTDLAEPIMLPSVTTFPNPTEYQWNPVAEGLIQPIGLANAGDGSDRLFIIEQGGKIRIFQNGQLLPDPFLDVSQRVSQGNELGLLGMAFNPNYANNGLFYINLTDKDKHTYVLRYQVSDNPNIANNGSATTLLKIRQPYPNHNGGHLEFGPDGYLYIGMGDGGAAGDPENNAQNLNSLLGKMLRLDVDNGQPYTIPVDNPFVNGGGSPEIWGLGLRNPWKFSFDQKTGDLYIADVGQNQWEEVHFVTASAPGGINFGWKFWEGLHAYEGQPPKNSNFDFPVWEYSHEQGCSITGGIVYRGTMPEWQGIYIYGDFCSGRVWGLLRDTAGVWQNTQLFQTDYNIAAFGEDEAGEIYLMDRKGTIYTLVSK